LSYDVRAAIAIDPGEYLWCGISTQVAVKALRIDIVFAGSILDVAIIEGLDRHEISWAISFYS
jgi:hypothetical protein